MKKKSNRQALNRIEECKKEIPAKKDEKRNLSD